jgi:phospholipid/cholesterol/gamma-HCH transport system substrate-binding protein
VKVSDESKVGIFVIVSLTMLFFGYNFLKGKDLFRKTNKFYAPYVSIDGLDVSNPVFLYGHRVGKVESISLIKSGDKKVIVKFSVKEDIEVPYGTVAEIINSDLLGSKAITLHLGNELVFHECYDTLIGKTELSIAEALNEVLSPLQKRASSLMANVDRFIAQLDTVMKKGGQQDLESSLKSLKHTFANLEKSTQTVDRFISDETDRLSSIVIYLNNITKTLSDNRENISAILENLNAVSDSIKQAEISSTLIATRSAIDNLNGIIQKINQGEGSIGLLIHNDSLYYNLESASNNLDKLMFDLKENPDRYLHFSIFGRNPNKKKKKK